MFTPRLARVFNKAALVLMRYAPLPPASDQCCGEDPRPAICATYLKPYGMSCLAGVLLSESEKNMQSTILGS